MKFKVGNRVKFIGKYEEHIKDKSTFSNLTLRELINKYNNCLTIEKIEDDGNITIKEDELWIFKQDELELVSKQFTISDLQDGDIVTYRNGMKRTKLDEELIDESGWKYGLSINFNENLTHINGIEVFDIIKVERPVKYETVFERKEEILNETEKRYLNNVIKPWRNKVVSVIKSNNVTGKKECIVFNLKKEPPVALPYFKTGSQYKNIKVNREYTLEELRTIKEK